LPIGKRRLAEADAGELVGVLSAVWL